MNTFTGKRIHILGIAGTLMGAFACYLKRAGVEVSGSDQNIYPPMSDVLKKAGVSVYTPFHSDNLNHSQPDLVIVGNVIRKDNPEMLAVVSKGINYFSLPSALEKFILPAKHSIVVAGTHGKTTTTSMLAWMLENLKENPSFFVGGVLQNFPESFRVTDSKYMVLEGDEYDTAYFDKVPKFVHYLPKDVILTSIEYDHADIYPNINAVIAAFDSLAELTPTDGYFITCGEYETTLRVALHSKSHVITYGFSKEVESRASQIETTAQGTSFRWHTPSQDVHKVYLKTSGKHNILNALGCLTLAQARHWDIDKSIKALSTYEGVKRRQEVFAIDNGITLLDDFAHHPTAVRETLSAIRAKYPETRIFACFEPRSATSRRRIFQDAYADSFEGADFIYIAKPYDQTRIDPKEQFSTEELIDSLKKRGKKSKILLTTDEGIHELAKELRPSDVVLVMSNGGFDGLLQKLHAKLSK